MRSGHAKWTCGCDACVEFRRAYGREKHKERYATSLSARSVKSQYNKEYRKRPYARESKRARDRERYARAEVKAAARAYRARPEVRARKRLADRAYLQRDGVLESRRAYRQLPHVKERHNARNRARGKRPDVMARQRKRFARPDMIAARREYVALPDVRERIRENRRRAYRRKRDSISDTHWNAILSVTANKKRRIK